MKTYLVTGAAGFIGSNVVRKLLNDGANVIGIDNISSYYDPAIKEYRLNQLEEFSDFTFIKGDITDKELLASIFNDYSFDAVINLAAQAGVRNSLEHPEVYYRTNVDGLLNILQNMVKRGVKKLVQASTSSLYAGKEGPYKEDMPIQQPRSPYAASKGAAEMMAYAYFYNFHIDISILRFFTVFGPAGRPDMSIFRFVHAIATGDIMTLYGNGEQSRAFSYVSDIVNGTVSAIRPLGYEVINLGGNEVIKINEVIKKIEETIGKKANIEYKPFHVADMMATSANCTKAKELLEWSPQVSFDEGLCEIIKWYLDNQDWLRQISFKDRD